MVRARAHCHDEASGLPDKRGGIKDLTMKRK